MMSQGMADAGRLRRAYLGQDEWEGARPRSGRCLGGTGQGFTLGGHRLASLYRNPENGNKRLKAGKLRPLHHSSWQKYANSDRATGTGMGKRRGPR
jgi:hypothetical protein